MVKRMTAKKEQLAERVLSLRMGPAGSKPPPKPLFSFGVIGRHLRRDPKQLYRLVQRYIEQQRAFAESSLNTKATMEELVAPDFLQQQASLTLQERVQLFNEQLKPPGAKPATVHQLLKLYRKHGVKWKKVQVLRQPDNLNLDATSRQQQLAQL